MSEMRRIGQFEIQDLLGEGGIGQVFAGRDSVLDRMVAIKSLRAELLNDKSFVDRFRGEAKNLALLTHPNITTLYTLLEDGGSLYMVMELVRGRTLEAILEQRNSPFSTDEALAMVVQAADGLAYAHDMGIVHRDIKPANLIITNTGRLKIMDFGIARAQGSQRMTRDGSIVGTLAYMSPEQCRGQDVDGRTDQYSLAIVLYEMLTGKVPFEASADYELMQAHINTTPELPSRYAPGMSPQVEKALMKALSKKASDRFPTLAAFKDALGATASRSDTTNIVHKATRLADISAMSSSKITSAMTSVTESFNNLPVPFAVKGIVAGGGLALILAVGLLYLLSPRQVVQNNPVTKVSNETSAPVQVAPQQQNNPYFIDQRRPASTPSPQPAQPASRPSGGKAPVEVAAEPQNPGPAAGNQPAGQPRRVPPAQNSSNTSDVAADSAPETPQRTASAGPSSEQSSGGRKGAEKDVLAAYEAKDFTKARELAEACAKDNNVDCQFIMGRLLETGAVGDKDPGAAADWYRKAAESGSAKARYNLGSLYYVGAGVPKDPRMAAEWFAKAAYQNHPLAQYSLALQYALGDGVPKNYSEARRWLGEVVEKSGDPELVASAQEVLDKLSGGRRRR